MIFENLVMLSGFLADRQASQASRRRPASIASAKKIQGHDVERTHNPTLYVMNLKSRLEMNDRMGIIH